MSNHITEKWLFEIGSGDRDKAFRIQTRIFELFRGTLKGKIEEVLDRAEARFGSVRIERLYLNLGNLDEANWEDDLQRRLPQALLEAIEQQVIPQHFAEQSKKVSGHEHSKTELLLYFLQYGVLPWWASEKKPDLSLVLLEVLTTEPGAFIAGISKLRNQHYTALRLAALVSEASFEVLVQQLEPSHAAFIIDFVSASIKSHQQEPFTSRNQSAFAQEIRQLVVLDLVRNHGTSFNRKMFVKRQLKAIAASSGLSFEQVLSDFTKGIASIDIPFSLRSALPALLVMIREEDIEDKHSNEDEDQLEKYRQFRAYLDGEEKDYSVELLKTAIADNGEAVIKVLRSLDPSEYVRPKLLLPFKKPVFDLLVGLLVPDHFSFIEDYTDNLFKIHCHKPVMSISTGEYELLVWEVILIDLITRHDTAFNRTQFVKRTLEKMAVSRRLSFKVLLEGFANAIKGMKLPAYFKTTLAGIVYSLQAQETITDRETNHPSLEAQALITTMLKGEQEFKRREFEIQWAYMALNEPEILKDLLLSLGKTDSGKDRILAVLKEDTLHDLVTVIQPTQAKTIIGYKARLDAAHKRQPIVKASQQAFSEAQWKVIVYYLLSDRGTRFNKKAFLKSLLLGLSQRYGVQYQNLLELLTIGMVEDYSSLGEDFLFLLNELKAEDSMLSKARQTHVDKRQDSGFIDLLELLKSYLAHGYIQWDLQQAFAGIDLRTEVIKWLEDDTRPWQSLFSGQSLNIEELQRLIRLVGVDWGRSLLVMVMEMAYNTKPSNQFMDSIESALPKELRQQELFYAMLLNGVLTQSQIDLEQILSEIQLDKPNVGKEAEPEQGHLMALFMAYLSGDTSASKSFKEVIAQLQMKPEQLRVLLKSLDERQWTSLLEMLNAEQLDELASALFDQAKVLQLLNKAFEKHMSKNALMMVHSTRRKHWRASFMTILHGQPFHPSTQWMTLWWQHLVGLLKLPDEPLVQIKKGVAKALPKTMSKSFENATQELKEALIQEHWQGSDRLLVLLQSAKNLKSAERDLLESEWRSLLLRDPESAFQLMNNVRLDLQKVSGWVQDFSTLSLSAMLRVLYPSAHKWMLIWAKSILQVLAKHPYFKSKSSTDLGHFAWEVLFGLWAKQTFLSGGKKQFLEAYLGQLSALTGINQEKVQESLKSSLSEANIPDGQKRELTQLLGENAEGTEQIIEKAESREPDFNEEVIDNSEAFRDGIYIENAGLILLGPYFGRLFDRLGLTKDGQFISDEHQEKAVRITQYLTDGQVDAAEYQLALNKFLCAWPMAKAMSTTVEITAEEEELCEDLLTAVISNWQAIGNTSVKGFRESFLQREGKLYHGEMHWQLVVQSKAFDVLLDTIPWTYKTIKLPWMEELLEVDWR